MSTVSELYSSIGEDAPNNLYTVSFTGIPAAAGAFENTSASGITSLDALNTALTYRVTDVSIPSTEVGTYSVDWGAWTIDRPIAKVQTNRDVSFTVRVDKNYDIYKIFTNWKNAIQNETTGNTAAITSMIASEMTVEINTIAGASGLIVKFENVFPKSVGDLSFSQGGGDPITLSVTMNFMKINRNFSEDATNDGGGDTAE